MAPNPVIVNVEQRSLTTAPSDDNISNVATQKKHSWFRFLWLKRWNMSMNIPLLKKHKKKPRKEQPKVAISRSPRRWLIPIMIHIVPILAGIAIATINLKGYFVGNQFVGVTNNQGQSTALFSLQVTAKVLEIVVIGSLGFIVLDVVHYFLLFDNAGLPFSLAGARLTFNDISYLLSPAFWRGINALKSYSARILVAFLLLSCGILATFIGPAAALLLIPPFNPTWPAGGLRFDIPLTKSELWPMQLNSSYSGSDYCFNASEYNITSPRYLESDCSWYCGVQLAAHALYGAFGISGVIPVDDFLQLRDISWFSYNMITGPDNEGVISSTIWFWSGMGIANIISSGLYFDWLTATEGYQQGQGEPQPLPLSYNRYPIRDPSADQTMLLGMLAPAARVHCLSNEQNFSSTAVLPYPAIPANGSYLLDTNATFLIPSFMAENTSTTRTFWIPKPAAKPEIQDVQADGVDSSQLPSAFLLVQIPKDSESAGFIFTCSIDARWITNGTLLMQPSNEQTLLSGYDSPVAYTQIGDATFDAQGRPDTTGTSAPLDLEISWLEQLTPALNQTLPGTILPVVSPGYTSMARSISESSFPAYLQHNGRVIAFVKRLEVFVSMLTVDGMARINLDNLYDWPVAETWTNQTTDLDILFPGGGGTDSLSRNASEMAYPEFLWTVSISGYGYATESTGDILALVVIFIYILFALGHMGFVFYKRWYSSDWWSVADMIALSQNSPPSDLLKNTSGGVEAASTNRLLLKLRAPDVPLGDRENIQVLVCSDKNDLGYRRPAGYHKIEKEKAYY